jgi:acyl transferase domain-containing protein
MQGVLDVCAPLSPRRNKNQPLYIGSSKANIGHGESAAGSTALIKVLLMFQKSAIPPHIGIKTTMNPRFGQDFDQRNLRIPFAITSWESKQITGKKRIAVVNNFGAAGGNTTMVLEEAPIRYNRRPDPRHTHVVTVSAKTRNALEQNMKNLIAYITAAPETNLADLAYTTTARRYHHRYRVAFATSSISQLEVQLQSSIACVDATKPVRNDEDPSIAFSFTGQGASYKSMNSDLFRHIPAYREQIQRFDALARAQGFSSFIGALDGSNDKTYEHSPVVTQLALVCTEMALASYWSSLGIEPDIVIGHSLGEYAAMYVAGVITASDAIYMVGKRAELLQKRCEIGSHTMVAVRASTDQIDHFAGGRPYTIACINGPSDTVLSGTQKQVAEVVTILQANDIRCIKLDVAFAFHSEQTDPILDDFEALVESSVVFQEPNVPIISPLLGKVVFDGKTLNANYVRRATRETVNFVAALQDAQQTSAISDETSWIEIGPHSVCTGFIKSTIPTTKLAFASNRREEEDWKPLATGLAALHTIGVEIGWNEFHRPFESDLQLLDLPTYSFDDKIHWLQYNGNWCLTKGNDFYTNGSSDQTKHSRGSPMFESRTSSVHRCISEAFDLSAGSCSITFQSDLSQPDLWAAAYGHRMNDSGVVTSVSPISPYIHTLALVQQCEASGILRKTSHDLHPIFDINGSCGALDSR